MTTTTDPRAAAEEALALTGEPTSTLRASERFAERARTLPPILARAVIEAWPVPLTAEERCPAAVRDSHCGALNAQGLACTLRPGHPDHVAEGPSEVLARWPAAAGEFSEGRPVDTEALLAADEPEVAAASRWAVQAYATDAPSDEQIAAMLPLVREAQSGVPAEVKSLDLNAEVERQAEAAKCRYRAVPPDTTLHSRVAWGAAVRPLVTKIASLQAREPAPLTEAEARAAERAEIRRRLGNGAFDDESWSQIEHALNGTTASGSAIPVFTAERVREVTRRVLTRGVDTKEGERAVAWHGGFVEEALTQAAAGKFGVPPAEGRNTQTQAWHPFMPGMASEHLCCFCGKTAAEHIGAVVAAMEAVLTGMGWEQNDSGLWAEDGNDCHTWGTHNAFRSVARGRAIPPEARPSLGTADECSCGAGCSRGFGCRQIAPRAIPPGTSRTAEPQAADTDAKSRPWNWCAKCEVTVDDDMRTGEFRDGSEGTCPGCRTVYVAVSFGDDSWELHERDGGKDTGTAARAERYAAAVAEHRLLAVEKTLRLLTEAETVRLAALRSEIDRLETAMSQDRICDDCDDPTVGGPACAEHIEPDIETEVAVHGVPHPSATIAECGRVLTGDDRSAVSAAGGITCPNCIAARKGDGQ